VVSMPVIVPVSAVIAAKISLFHLARSIMCVISSVVRISVIVMANFTPMTKRGSGGISRRRVRFVSAFFIQSCMVFRLFLAFVSGDVGFAAD
jgi:hypothetical protein